VPHFRFVVLALGLALSIFAGIFVFLELGRRLWLRQVEKHGPETKSGVGVVDAAVYGLLGLLIGFTFSGAASRFDHRRAIIGTEVSAVENVWRRIDLLPADAQPVLRARMRDYVDALIASYDAEGPLSQALNEPPAVMRARNDLWTPAVAATVAPSGEAARVLLHNALSDMFGAVEDERFARRMHSSVIIYAMLAVAALASAIFAGYGLASKGVHNRLYTIGVAATIGMAMYVIIELEYPRLGLIRISAMDRALADVRATMK
jgi:hypothetical protein